MSQVHQVVRRALLLLRALDPNESPEAQQMQDAIEVLNAFMASIEARGIATGWSPVSNPGDEMPTAPELDRAIAYNLAVELRPTYGGSIDADVVAGAESGLSLMRQQVMANTFARLDLDLPMAESDYCNGAAGFYKGG